MRCLRYFIFSEYKVDRLREDEIYRWFADHDDICGYKKDPARFVDLLIEAAQAYTNFLDGVDVDGEENRYLQNLRFMSGAARQHLILLLAGRALSPPNRIELSRQIENLFSTFVITRRPTRDFERLFAMWAPELRQASNDVAFQAFVTDRISKEKAALAKRFNTAFTDFYEGDTQKYRLRYILAKLTQHIDEMAYGSSGAAGNLGTYINKRVSIEHIFPQRPSNQAREEFDKPDEMDWVSRLGNLTLLESTEQCEVLS